MATATRNVATQTILAGTGFEGRPAIIRRYCRTGMPVQLVREPNNAHDPNAVAVYIETTRFLVFRAKQQIGYLKSALAVRAAPKIDTGRLRRAWVDTFWAPAGRDHPRVTICIEFAEK